MAKIQTQVEKSLEGEVTVPKSCSLIIDVQIFNTKFRFIEGTVNTPKKNHKGPVKFPTLARIILTREQNGKAYYHP